MLRHHIFVRVLFGIGALCATSHAEVVSIRDNREATAPASLDHAPGAPNGKSLPTDSKYPVAPEGEKASPAVLQSILKHQFNFDDEKRDVFTASLNKAVGEAKAGKPAALHQLLDTTRGEMKDACLECEKQLQKYFADANEPAIAALMALRSEPTPKLLEAFHGGKSDPLASARQQEYWRRVNAMVEASQFIISPNQATNFLANYHSRNNPEMQGVMIAELLSMGLMPETIDRMASNILRSNPFPCGESLAEQIAFAARNRGLDRQGNLPPASLPTKKMTLQEKVAFTAGLDDRLAKLKNDEEIFDFNDVIEPGREAQMFEEKRTQFLNHLASKDRQNPLKPELGDYFKMQVVQATDPNRNVRDMAVTRLMQTAEAFSFKDARGTYLWVNGQRVSLTGNEAQDVAILSKQNFSGANIAVPPVSRMARASVTEYSPPAPGAAPVVNPRSVEDPFFSDFALRERAEQMRRDDAARGKASDLRAIEKQLELERQLAQQRMNFEDQLSKQKREIEALRRQLAP